MYYSPLVLKASRIMADAHRDDLDKSGYPYVFHPYHLAAQMEDEDSVCAALLHDVVEDHGDRYGFDVLAAEGFPPQVLSALRLLTHEPDIPYMDYVRAIAEDPLARRVKIADLKHNLDIRRMGGIKTKKYPLYQEALALLERAEKGEV